MHRDLHFWGMTSPQCCVNPLLIIVTLSAKTSLVLGEIKAVFPRKGHIYIYQTPVLIDINKSDTNMDLNKLMYSRQFHVI